MKYTNQTLMPFGKYYGEKLAKVPSTYLLWLYRECSIKNEMLKIYIEENLDVLKAKEKDILEKRKIDNRLNAR